MTYSQRRGLQVVLIIIFFIPSIGFTSPMGINLAEPYDYSPANYCYPIQFSMRTWLAQTQSSWSIPRSQGFLQEFKDGAPCLAPGVNARSLVRHDVDGLFRKGNYHIFFEGQGNFDLEGGRLVQALPGHHIYHVDGSSNTLHLVVNQNACNDHLRNFKIVHEDDLGRIANQQFHPDCIQYWQRFLWVRAMDLTQTNYRRVGDLRTDSSLLEWKDRTPANAYSQLLSREDPSVGQTGMAYEHLVELANSVNRDLWLNIPHHASDDFVRKLAELLKNSLNPQLEVMIEFSNELWNFAMFRQGDYAIKQGKQRGLGSNQWHAARRYTAERIAEIAEIFADVYGAEFFSRVEMIGADQMAPEFESILLTHQVSFQGKNYLFAQLPNTTFALAPYFERSSTAPMPSTEQELEQQLRQGIKSTVDSLKLRVAGLRSLSSARLITYEAGQHLVSGNNTTLKRLYHDINQSGAMKSLYAEYLSEVRQALQGEVITHFNDFSTQSIYGSWGMLTTLLAHAWHHPQPKYHAVMEFIDQFDTDTKPELDGFFPVTIENGSRQFVVLRGDFPDDSTVYIDGRPASYVWEAREGTKVVSFAKGTAPRKAKVQVQNSNGSSRVVEVEILSAARQAPQLIGANFGVGQWDRIPSDTWTTLMLHGRSFHSLSQVLVAGIPVPFEHVTVYDNETIFVRWPAIDRLQTFPVQVETPGVGRSSAITLEIGPLPW